MEKKISMDSKEHTKENDTEIAETTDNKKDNDQVVNFEMTDCRENTNSESLSVSEKERDVIKGKGIIQDDQSSQIRNSSFQEGRAGLLKPTGAVTIVSKGKVSEKQKTGKRKKTKKSEVTAKKEGQMSVNEKAETT